MSSVVSVASSINAKIDGSPLRQLHLPELLCRPNGLAGTMCKNADMNPKQRWQWLSGWEIR